MTITLFLFYFLSAFSIISGILTIIQGKNPINSVVNLVSCFLNSALILMLMGVELLGFIYIIVYVGAIAILFIFVIMMMDLRFTLGGPSRPFGQSGTQNLKDTPSIVNLHSFFLFITIFLISYFLFYVPEISLDVQSRAGLFFTNFDLNDIINQISGGPSGEILTEKNAQENWQLNEGKFILEGPSGHENLTGKNLIQDFTTWEIANLEYWEDFIQNSMNNIIQVVGYLFLTDFLTLLLLASLILLMIMISVITLVLFIVPTFT